MKQYDTIVIGSGIGGLTAAALLSKVYGQRVLVLEKHWVAGGFTHEFKRGKFKWDVGIHYIGNMKSGDMGRNIFDFITDNHLQWNKMPDDFEHFIYPDFTFRVPSDLNEYKKRLCEMFPEESSAIHRYFRDTARAIDGLTARYQKKITPWPVSMFFALNARLKQELIDSTTKAYLDKNFHSEKLKALLTSQWGDYGLPPGQSSFGIHSTIVMHYANGAYFPVGGSSSIANTIIPVIQKTGGEVLVDMAVEKIIVENGKAVGVIAQKVKGEKTEYRASRVISNTGARETFGRLLTGEESGSIREIIEKPGKGKSSVTVYIGFKDNPAKLGFKGENHWIYTTYDHDSIPAQNLGSSPLGCYLSFPSLKDPEAKSHTAEIIAFADIARFESWRNGKWKKRGDDYEALKKEIEKALIGLVEKKYPGFSSMIEYTEVSTPLSIEFFTSHVEGEIYGIPSNSVRSRLNLPFPKTHIKNLYIAGADVFGLGIMGAMMGGLACAASCSGPAGFFKIFGAIFQNAAARKKKE